MATAAGGTILSHVNDAGFWCVKEYLGMSVPDTLRSWTLMKIFTSLLGFGTMLLAFTWMGPAPAQRISASRSSAIRASKRTWMI